MAFDQTVQQDNNLATSYVIMSDIYTAVSMHENGKNIGTMNRTL